MMSDRISWTTQLGQAVAANQSAVMAAIQQVRRQAQAAGNLQSNDKQVVSVQGTGDTSTIIIEPANPQVIYVPQYNPVAILAPPPPYYYGNPGYGLLTFGVGFAAGAATAYACNWGYYGGYGSVTVNNYYHYNANNHYAAYHPNSGIYTGYNSKTGTYGAYNPATGKYGTYNPSTGAYNKNGQTGTWHPPSADDVGRSAGDYGASQYRAGGGYGGGDPGRRRPVPRKRPVARLRWRIARRHGPARRELQRPRRPELRRSRLRRRMELGGGGWGGGKRLLRPAASATTPSAVSAAAAGRRATPAIAASAASAAAGSAASVVAASAASAAASAGSADVAERR